MLELHIGHYHRLSYAAHSLIRKNFIKLIAKDNYKKFNGQIYLFVIRLSL